MTRAARASLGPLAVERVAAWTCTLNEELQKASGLIMHTGVETAHCSPEKQHRNYQAAGDQCGIPRSPGRIARVKATDGGARPDQPDVRLTWPGGRVPGDWFPPTRVSSHGKPRPTPCRRPVSGAQGQSALQGVLSAASK